MSDCLFCKIVAGEIPNYTVYQNDEVLAFLDIHPCSQGHTVVIPKRHFARLEEMDTDSWQQLSAGLKIATSKVQTALKPDGMNVGINNGEAAGQAVAHVHWHIIPRWQNDGGGSMHSIVRSKDSGDVAIVARLFRN
ncbi:MAG: HIT family protein [Candidatus Magasanikbacteria bacterium]|nr:HIT family protein [Candidatus Magasanikbacteria bacterium]